ncbi:HNH endonuclease [Kitasatospora sp. NPDC089913]|uniref:HNH endonuclease n=1 Tax=Kitasatospora sp. NPDC089913 TaxID=3364080 RepID=UPI00381E685A
MTAWLMYMGDDPKRVGSGYDDSGPSHYSWDSRVPNAGHVQVGDEIVLWDGQTSIGMSVIEDIVTRSASKEVSSCPSCGKADIAERKTKTPKYRCWNQNCKAEFGEPKTQTVPVTTYRSRYDFAWIGLPGVVSGSELRELCEEPGSQNAMRRLRWDDFQHRIETGKNATPLEIIKTTRDAIAGGHSKAMVRVRRGQPAFRAALLDVFGEVCAFTGPAPACVLEAAHLYSYAANGKHHANGGLLLRRDVHRLFDLGQISIDPQSLALDVAPKARAYPEYAKLHGQVLAVPITNAHKKWIAKHWRMHRDVGASTASPTLDGP